jgi:hypothetical protein
LGRRKAHGSDRGFFVSDELPVGGMRDGKREVLPNGGAAWFLVVLVFGSRFVQGMRLVILVLMAGGGKGKT